MIVQKRRHAAFYVSALLLGCLLGVLGARELFVGSALSLIPWGLVALSVGAVAASARIAAAAGGLYGFALGFSFMVAGYNGTTSLLARLAPFAAFGAIGACCGASLATAAAMLLRLRSHR